MVVLAAFCAFAEHRRRQTHGPVRLCGSADIGDADVR